MCYRKFKKLDVAKIKILFSGTLIGNFRFKYVNDSLIKETEFTLQSEICICMKIQNIFALRESNNSSERSLFYLIINNI